MPFGEPQELKRSVEKSFEFNDDVRCALERAFKNNPEVSEQLADAVGKDQVQQFIDLLGKEKEMKFLVPSEDMKTVYEQVAKRELERIDAEDEDDEDLSCYHKVEEHVAALETVVQKMRHTIN